MRLLTTLLTIIFFTACSHSDKVPANILSPERMKPILWDMLAADQLVLSRDVGKTDSLKDLATNKFEEVFAAHKISKETFYKSFRYYEEHPDVLKVLFDSVSAYGTRMRGNLNTRKKLPAR